MTKRQQPTLQLKPLQSYDDARLVSLLRRLLRRVPAGESQQFIRALHLLAQRQIEQEELAYAKVWKAVASA